MLKIKPRLSGLIFVTIMTNPQNWRIEDHFTGIEISQILPISERFNSMLARVKNRESLVSSMENIFGIVFMARELEYHFEIFQRFHSSITPCSFSPIRSSEEQKTIEKMRFEAFAYINTLGRLYYWISERGSSNAPKIIEIVEAFRHKYTAHRSSDKTKNETDYEKEVHHYVILGNFFRDNQLVLRIQKTQGSIVEFNFTKDHDVIMNEFIEVFSKFLEDLKSPT